MFTLQQRDNVHFVNPGRKVYQGILQEEYFRKKNVNTMKIIIQSEIAESPSDVLTVCN